LHCCLPGPLDSVINLFYNIRVVESWVHKVYLQLGGRGCQSLKLWWTFLMSSSKLIVLNWCTLFNFHTKNDSNWVEIIGVSRVIFVDINSNNTTSSTDFSFRNLVFWNWFEFSAAEFI
jgi:hypothetical protein